MNGVLASNGLTNPRRSSVLTFGQPARVAATKRAANVPNNLAAGPVEGHDHVQKSRKGRKGWKPIIRSVALEVVPLTVTSAGCTWEVFARGLQGVQFFLFGVC